MHKIEPFGRCQRLAAVIVTLAAVFGASGSLAVVAEAALPPGCSQSGQLVSCTVTFTSGSNPFAVPAGVTSIHVVAVGGRGALRQPAAASAVAAQSSAVICKLPEAARCMRSWAATEAIRSHGP